MSQAGELTDQTIVDILRRRPWTRVADLASATGVTTTAVRQRLNRLQENGLVERRAEPGEGRGRPTYRYRLTEAGFRSAGNNYDQLVMVLWEEIRSIPDPEIRRGLLKRIADRLASIYREEVDGETIEARMESLVRLMSGRDVPFELDDSQSLPVLTALACPYPDLAEQDRGVCAMEKMLFTEVLGEGIRLSTCRLDGDDCCTFETGSAEGAE